MTIYNSKFWNKVCLEGSQTLDDFEADRKIAEAALKYMERKANTHFVDEYFRWKSYQRGER